jgi:hypothetical protein
LGESVGLAVEHEVVDVLPSLSEVRWLEALVNLALEVLRVIFNAKGNLALDLNVVCLLNKPALDVQ